MRQLRDAHRLALEAREGVRVSRQRRRQDLDRDVALEARVAGAKDLAHTSGAQHRQDFVLT